MMMRLSKVVPSRRKTIEFNWAWKNFTVGAKELPNRTQEG